MPGLIQSIERSSAVLRLLAAGPGRLRVKEVADSLGLPKSTAHSILRTLGHVGFVEQDPDTGRYRLGRALLEIDTLEIDVNELRGRALDWSDTLASRSGEQVRICVLRDGSALVIHHVFRPDDSAQSMDTGRLLPLHATALGKVLLSYDAVAADAVTRNPLIAYTRRTIGSPRQLTRSLAEIRSRGWAQSVEEFEAGQAGIAAPIRSSGGLLVGAIGIAGTVERLGDTHGLPKPALVKNVCDIARAISRDLAGPRP